MVQRRFLKRGLALAGLAVAVAGCSTTQRVERIPPPPPPPPANFHPFAASPSDAPVKPPPPASATAATERSAPVKVIPSHRQYFDQRRQRYYFYDPARRAYFWEDGTPKG